MWRLFKKRQEDDLRRLVSAYRGFLKAQAQCGSPDLAWRGGFGKAVHLLFGGWPTPNESRRFEKQMLRRLAKTDDFARAFILAFNDYLGQKRLNPKELSEVIEQGRAAFNR